ncbi:MAG: DUF3488 and transglutaminase-like domain-containing protein [Planctomycetota bacterium]
MTEFTDSPRLQASLVALVLSNVVFVHLTGAVTWWWLVPLYVLTLGAPLLRHLRPSLVYRALWNISVMAIFALLVHHASSGIEHLLEDGLILAAICQVHLLNNLGPRQRPDLLFFNSFLIALVTSFFCQDVEFAALFAVYAGILTVGLQLSCAADSGAAHAPHVLWDGGRRAVATLAVTAIAFATLPRDFERPGLVSETLMRSGSQVGFSETVMLGRSGRAILSNRVVLRIRLLKGSRADVPAHWRGATFAQFSKGSWMPLSGRLRFGGSVDRAWQQTEFNAAQRGDGRADGARLAVTVEGQRAAGHVFAPLESNSVRLIAASGNRALIPYPDGTLAAERGNRRRAAREPLHYELALNATTEAEEHSARPRHGSWGPIYPYMQYASDGLGEQIVQLTQRLIGDQRAAPQHVVAERLRRHLASSYSYLLPGAQGAARDLEHFLSGAAGGHCEYFATALCLMLRSQNIPCRLATGYLCEEWDETGRLLTVRSRHAHAWVEVRDPAGFWYAVDPTPAAGATAEVAQTLLGQLGEQLGALWGAVTTFDGDARDQALQALAAAPGQAARWTRRHPLTATAALLLIGTLVVRRRRHGEPLVIRAYHRAVARTRLRRLPGETPREHLARARHADLDATRLEALEAAMTAHEAARYR